MRVFNLFVKSAGAMFLAYKLTFPAAWLMRGVLPFAHKCADQCPGEAVIPNWNSVNKKKLDLLCKSVYIYT